MTYLSWAIFAEGPTDVEYLSALLPRVITSLVSVAENPIAIVPEEAVEVFGKTSRVLDHVAQEVCGACESFFILFVHGDTGSSGQERGLAARTCALCEKVNSLCQLVLDRCVIVAPRRETEAWCLCDKSALRSVFGIGEKFDLSFVPDDPLQIEKIIDPKILLTQLMNLVLGDRKAARKRFPFATIAQMQSIEQLRFLPSFQTFELALKSALGTLGHKVE